MKVIVHGHEYEVSNAEANRVIGVLHFIRKEQKDGKLVTVKDGTTTEEVIRVLIDRLEHLDSKVKAKENKVALKHLRGALTALSQRTRDREARAVEGTNKE